MKRRRPARPAFAPTDAMTAAMTTARATASAVRTGEHCPESGWWCPLQQGVVPAAPARFISEGSVMPAVDGAPGAWLPRLGAPRAAAVLELSR